MEAQSEMDRRLEISGHRPILSKFFFGNAFHLDVGRFWKNLYTKDAKYFPKEFPTTFYMGFPTVFS
jgi:hypothetical protein